MKWLALIFALSSCSAPFYLNTEGYEKLHGDLMESWAKVASMEYQGGDTEGYYKSPHEFFRDGGGDCEDFAVALVYLLGKDSAMVLIGEKMPYHAIVEYKGLYIEAQQIGVYYNPQDIKVAIRYDYLYTMENATLRGTKSIRGLR